MKRIFEEFKTLVFILLSLPLGFVMYMVYVHFVSFIDPVLTVVLGGGFLLLIIGWFILLLNNAIYFIVSIFKKDRGVDERGFNKF